jgi:hypothetical protein
MCLFFCHVLKGMEIQGQPVGDNTQQGEGNKNIP